MRVPAIVWSVTDERIIYRGMRMTPDWPLRIESAQKEPGYVIGGQTHARIRYGSETDDWGADTRPCHDCGVSKGRVWMDGCFAAAAGCQDDRRIETC